MIIPTSVTVHVTTPLSLSPAFEEPGIGPIFYFLTVSLIYLYLQVYELQNTIKLWKFNISFNPFFCFQLICGKYIKLHLDKCSCNFPRFCKSKLLFNVSISKKKMFKFFCSNSATFNSSEYDAKVHFIPLCKYKNQCILLLIYAIFLNEGRSTTLIIWLLILTQSFLPFQKPNMTSKSYLGINTNFVQWDILVNH